MSAAKKATKPDTRELSRDGIRIPETDEELAHEFAARAPEHSLEDFKAQLKFDAEVRRQAASRKVDALLQISDATIALMRVFLSLESTVDNKQRMAAMFEWSRPRVHAEVLLTAGTIAELDTFMSVVTRTNEVLGQKELGARVQPEELTAAEIRLSDARLRLFEVLRQDLQVLAPGRAISIPLQPPPGPSTSGGR